MIKLSRLILGFLIGFALINFCLSVLVVIPIENWYAVSKAMLIVNFLNLFISASCLGLKVKGYRGAHHQAVDLQILPEEGEE